MSAGSALSARSRWSLLSAGGDRDVLAWRVPSLALAGGAAVAVLLLMGRRGT